MFYMLGRPCNYWGVPCMLMYGWWQINRPWPTKSGVSWPSSASRSGWSLRFAGRRDRWLICSTEPRVTLILEMDIGLNFSTFIMSMNRFKGTQKTLESYWRKHSPSKIKTWEEAANGLYFLDILKKTGPKSYFLTHSANFAVGGGRVLKIIGFCFCLAWILSGDGRPVAQFSTLIRKKLRFRDALKITSSHYK